jgi:hypothetical protein
MSTQRINNQFNHLLVIEDCDAFAGAAADGAAAAAAAAAAAGGADAAATVPDGGSLPMMEANASAMLESLPACF